MRSLPTESTAGSRKRLLPLVPAYKVLACLLLGLSFQAGLLPEAAEHAEKADDALAFAAAHELAPARPLGRCAPRVTDRPALRLARPAPLEHLTSAPAARPQSQRPPPVG